jgi:hypothetical protein
MFGFMFALLAMPLSQSSAEPKEVSATLSLSLTPTKYTYDLGEPLEFEIRIDNPTDQEVCVPMLLRGGEGYLLYKTTDPSGKRVEYECEILDEFLGDARDMVCLMPGAFYGVRDRHSGLSSQGEWTFVATYYGPSSSEYSRLCDEEISSGELTIIVGIE